MFGLRMRRKRTEHELQKKKNWKPQEWIMADIAEDETADNTDIQTELSPAGKTGVATPRQHS